ncbi:MAG TPA: HPr family phosphocarrier protein [Candidatus Fournierella merdigallinarum]|nr:HPr family phosphocarrier protein [Candidatus Fournierella merdigallinarum]
MEKATITITNRSGLHARPAAAFVTEAKKFRSKLTIQVDGRSVNGKSMVALLSAGITCGKEIGLTFEGEDEKEAASAVCSFIRSGCGESG